MRKCVFAFALVFFAFTMSSCVLVAHGPSDNAADAQYVQSIQTVVDSNEAIAFMDKGYFVANAAKPGPTQTWGASGTIVVTDKTLYFLFWNRHASTFDVIRKLPIADIANIDHISSIFNPVDSLSIEDKNHRFDVFSCQLMFSKDNQNLVEKNRKLMNCLNEIRNAK